MVKTRRYLRRILGSLLAVTIAWLISIALLEVKQVFDYFFGGEQLSWNALWATPLFFTMWIWAFAFPVWLVALVPLSLFVPSSSLLWRWPICTACGALAGAVVVAIVFPIPRAGIASEIWFPYTLGALVGGVTCLIGSLTRHSFEQPRPTI